MTTTRFESAARGVTFACPRARPTATVAVAATPRHETASRRNSCCFELARFWESCESPAAEPLPEAENFSAGCESVDASTTSAEDPEDDAEELVTRTFSILAGDVSRDSAA